MAHAANDPRGFLLELPGIDKFVAGLKVAVDLSPDKGYCLQHGEYMGFGCINDGKSQQICQCKGSLERCWVETNEQKLMSSYQAGNTEEAMEYARALLFGQCYIPVWIRLAIGIGGLAVLAGVAVAAKKIGSGRLGSWETPWRGSTSKEDAKATDTKAEASEAKEEH